MKRAALAVHAYSLDWAYWLFLSSCAVMLLAKITQSSTLGILAAVGFAAFVLALSARRLIGR